MTYYLVKLKPDCRWLDAHGYWDISRDMADRFGSRRAANEAAQGCEGYEAGDVVVVRVRTVKRKVIPVPKIEVTPPTAPGDVYRVLVNGVETTSYCIGFTHRDRAEGHASLLRRALGIPEST